MVSAEPPEEEEEVANLFMLVKGPHSIVPQFKLHHLLRQMPKMKCKIRDGWFQSYV